MDLLKKAALSQQQLLKTPRSRKKNVRPCSKYSIFGRRVFSLVVALGKKAFDLGQALCMLFTQGSRQSRAPYSGQNCGRTYSRPRRPTTDWPEGHNPELRHVRNLLAWSSTQRLKNKGFFSGSLEHFRVLRTVFVCTRFLSCYMVLCIYQKFLCVSL